METEQKSNLLKISYLNRLWFFSNLIFKKQKKTTYFHIYFEALKYV